MVKKTSNLFYPSCTKIGVIDSGRGGLTVLKSLVKNFHANYYYLADLKNLPYGEKTPEQLLALTIQNIKFLENYNLKIIIFACHTLSAIVLPDIKKIFPHILFIGVLEPVIQTALKSTKNKKIGVMATVASILNSGHKKAMLTLDAAVKVTEIACPMLASMIEKLPTNSPEIASILLPYSDKLAHAQVDTLILGCTHYGFIKKLIKSKNIINIISAEDVIIDCIKKNYKLKTNNLHSSIQSFQTAPDNEFEKFIKNLFLKFKPKIKISTRIIHTS